MIKRPQCSSFPSFLSFHAPALAAAGAVALLLTSGALHAQDESAGPAQPSAPHGVYAGYRMPDEIAAAMRALADQYAHASISAIGTSREGRDLLLLTLSNDTANADARPAVLITAGLDGRHLMGSETAVRVAERLLGEDHAALLEQITIYVIPLANPDGAALNLGDVNLGHVGTVRPLDSDRDGAIDEDGPQDLNGDGVITQMRRPNPPLDDPAQWTSDPNAPRLLKKPDAIKGESAAYSLYTEGLDSDGDGLIAEDGAGMVDLDRNFMHLYPEHGEHAGPYQLCEPESLALAEFVVKRPNIFVAVTYGRHDNLINVPDGKGRDEVGRGPRNLAEDDVALYRAISDTYKEATGQKSAPREDIAGSFHAWLYAQRGVPSFASTVWDRPEAEKKKNGEEKAGGEGDDSPAGNGATNSTDAAAPDVDPVAGDWRGGAELPEFGMVEYTIALEHDVIHHTVTGTFSAAVVSLNLEGTFDPASNALVLTGSVGEDIIVPFDLVVNGNTMTGTATGPQGELVQIEAQRGAGGDEGDAASDAPRERGNAEKEDDKPADAEAAAWLKYSDEQRGGAGFVEWQAFEHPTLGEVEIGGFVAGFQMNPPSDALDALADKQVVFVAQLIAKRPQVTEIGPVVKRLAPGVYDVRFALRNDGLLPTGTRQSDMTRSVQPTVVRISTPVEQIISGDRVSRSFSIDGSGGLFMHYWIVQAEDGAELSIDINDPRSGRRTITFPADDTSNGAE